MKILNYFVALFAFSFLLFIISSSILHTNNPLTDFLLSILVVAVIMNKLYKMD